MSHILLQFIALNDLGDIGQDQNLLHTSWKWQWQSIRVNAMNYMNNTTCHTYTHLSLFASFHMQNIEKSFIAKEVWTRGLCTPLGNTNIDYAHNMQTSEPQIKVVSSFRKLA